MAKLSDVVELSISVNTRTPTQQGFGTPLLVAYLTQFPEAHRRYSDLDGLVADGFTSGHAAYKMAQAAFSQDPRPPYVRLGRLPAAHTHTQTVTITSSTEGAKIEFDLWDPVNETWVEIRRTIPAASSTSAEATAVELLTEAVPGVTSSAAAAVITITPATAGHVIWLRGPGGGHPTNCTIAETTADAGYDDQLSVIYGQTKDFYGITLDTNSHTNVDLVAAWAESRAVLFGYQTQDSAEKAGTGTLASGLQTSAYKRTFGKWVEDASQYSALGWMAKCLAKSPGSITWAFKSVAGDTPVTLTDTEEGNLAAVNLNWTVRVAGFTYVQPGKSAEGTFLDITHGKDAVSARIQEAVFGHVVNKDKIPNEDGEIDQVCGRVLAVLRTFETTKFLKAGTSTCTGPKSDEISDTDLADRVLPDIKFGARLGGAYHKIRIAGSLTL